MVLEFCICSRFLRFVYASLLYILEVAVVYSSGYHLCISWWLLFFVYAGGFSLYMLVVNLYMLVVPVKYFVYSSGLLVYALGFSNLYSLVVLFYLYILVVHLYILEVSVIYVCKWLTCIS